MTLTKTYFTYCDEDQSAIDQITSDLGKEVEVVHDLREEPRQRSTRNAMRNDKVPTWLFISDQFLHSSEAMNNILSFLEDPVLSVYIQPVLIGALKPDEFYIKHWEQKYLGIRARRDQIPRTGLETYNWRVIIIRSISNEIEEFLNHLKSFKIISLDEFKQNDYAYFYETQGVKPPEKEVPTIENPVVETVSVEKTIPTKKEPSPVVPPPIELNPSVSKLEIPTVKQAERVVMAEGTEEPIEAAPLAKAKIVEPTEPILEQTIEETAPMVAGLEEALPLETPIESGIVTREQPAGIVEMPEGEGLEIVPLVPEFEPLSLQILGDEEGQDIAESLGSTVENEEENTTKAPDSDEVFIEALKKSRQGKQREAIKMLKEILGENPDDPKINYQYGVLMQDFIGDTKTAFFHLEKVILHGTEEEDIYIRLAVLSEKLDDPFLAKNFYEKAILLNPEKAYTYYRLGLLIMRHFDRQLPQALTYFERSILLSPGQANAHFHYGKLLMELGHFKKAERELRVAIALDPDHQFAYYDLAKAYLELKKKKKAAKFYRLAYQSNDILRTAANNKLFRLDEKGDNGKNKNKLKKKKQPKKRTIFPEIVLKPVVTKKEKLAKQEKQKRKAAKAKKAAEAARKAAEAEELALKAAAAAKEEEDARKAAEAKREASKKAAAKAAALKAEEEKRQKEKAKRKEKAKKKKEAAAPVLAKEDKSGKKKTKIVDIKLDEETKPKGTKKKSKKDKGKKGKKPKATSKFVPAKAKNEAAPKPTADSEAPQQPAKSEAPQQIALITGATAGIGLSTAHELGKKGYNLILTGRRELRLHQIKRELKKAYDIKVKVLAFDIRTEKAVNKAIGSLAPKWQNIDILVNNAGLAKGFDPINEGDTMHWNAMIDTNIKGLLYVTLAVVPQMVERGTGHIINVGSVAGKEVYPKGGVYCATKHAVEALTKGMRMDFVDHGIRVSAVSPGHVYTEFALVRYEGDQDRVNEAYEGFDPLRPEDVAEVVGFIISRPTTVNIQDVLVFSAQQASAMVLKRRKE